MEQVACNIIYVDRRAKDEHIKRETLSSSKVARTSTGTFSPGYFSLGKPPPASVHTNVEAILSVFDEVYVCGSGSSCLTTIPQLLGSPQGSVPTVVLIDIPYEEERRLKRLSREPRTPSPTSMRNARIETSEPDDTYGMHLLMHLSSEIQSLNISKLVVPVVMLSGLEREWSSNVLSTPGAQGTQILTDTVRLSRYLDAGAVDVLPTPLSKDRVHGLAIHAYRLQKQASREQANFMMTKKNRKVSWVGMNDSKPYGYLREAMVSGLMSGICNPENVGDGHNPQDVYVEEDRREVVATAIGTWSFSAHALTDDELLYSALLMLKHALQVAELEHWRMTDDDLTIFLLASRTAYNDFVLYHNFRHVIDVLQALFYFLVQIRALPPYGHSDSTEQSGQKPPLAQLLTPFDSLTLLISAIGHDVGHPGVNNAFLVALNAPLAQLYNDRSVLESFHCAAYSQILRRYWPVAFEDSSMRKLMINNILATDMGLHFRYMKDLGNVQEKLAHDQDGIDGWNAKVCEEYKDLTCGLLIKCADISNVARKFDTAAQWAVILTDEFSNQGVMENELQIPSCLFGGPPVRDDIIKLAESQIGFINIFATPLFGAVADILPGMRFSVDEILVNKGIWQKKIEEEKNRESNQGLRFDFLSPTLKPDPNPSPLSGGPLKTPVVTVDCASDSPVRTAHHEDSGRRSSTGSIAAILSASRRSSLADKGSRRSSGVGVPGAGSFPLVENQNQSRRGSGDASITAILVTQTPSSTDGQLKDPARAMSHSTLPGTRKDTTAKSATKKSCSRSGDAEKDGVRPLTAPSSARRTQGTSLFPLSHPHSQSHSEVDLPLANGSTSGPKGNQWHSSKVSGDSTTSQPDTVRDNRRSEWWRPMGNRRKTRVISNGDANRLAGPEKQNEIVLDSVISNTTSTAPSPTSPNGKSRTGSKIKSFFKRKPRQNTDPEKQQLSSYGSSSQLRTPPTSDPGLSVNSED